MSAVIGVPHTERDFGKVAEVRFFIESLNDIRIDQLLRGFKLI